MTVMHGLIVGGAVFFASGGWLIWQIHKAPLGEQIKGIGFVDWEKGPPQDLSQAPCLDLALFTSHSAVLNPFSAEAPAPSALKQGGAGANFNENRDRALSGSAIPIIQRGSDCHSVGFPGSFRRTDR